MTPLETAQAYTARKWSVIPVPLGKKRPVLKGWQNCRLADADLPGHFNGRAHNIGVLLGEPSGGLTDVDLDCEEAVLLAPQFLPETGAVFGRASNRGSHHLYVSTVKRTVQFDDPVTAGKGGGVKARLLELRSTGAQTIFPGSVHESGEEITWERDGEPAHVDGDLLLSAVRKLAAASLLVRHYPNKGGRHKFALALAGGLLRGGWTGEDTASFIRAVCSAAGDEETDARVEDVRSTARKLRAGEKVIGFPSLAELLDERLVAKLSELFNVRARGKERQIAPNNEGEPQAAVVADKQRKPKFPTLSRTALYGLAGHVVRTILPHTEAHSAALLVQFLVAFGNVIGRRAHFVAEADKHYMNLFAVLVGETSKGRKGSSLGHVLRLFRAVDEEWVEKRVQGGLSSGEGLIWAVRDAIVKRVAIKDKSTGEINYDEEIVDPGVDDKRLMVTESEFASVLRQIAREGNTLSPLIRQAWDKGDLRSMTKNSPAQATGAHISIVGHITKDELRRNLDEVETANGFANRFVWVASRRSKLLPEGGNLTDHELNSLISSLHRALNFAREVGEMRRDDEARALWAEVYGALSSGHVGLFGSVTSRSEAQVMRFACVYALLDSSHVVRRVHLEAALALWRYCENSARFIFGDSTGDRVADMVLAALREAADAGLTKTEISNLLGRNAPASRLGMALSTLSEAGLARSVQEPADGGRPAVRWFAVELNSIDEEDEINEESIEAVVRTETEAEPTSFNSSISSDDSQAGADGYLPF